MLIVTQLVSWFYLVWEKDLALKTVSSIFSSKQRWRTVDIVGPWFGVSFDQFRVRSFSFRYVEHAQTQSPSQSTYFNIQWVEVAVQLIFCMYLSVRRGKWAMGNRRDEWATIQCRYATWRSPPVGTLAPPGWAAILWPRKTSPKLLLSHPIQSCRDSCKRWYHCHSPQLCPFWTLSFESWSEIPRERTCSFGGLSHRGFAITAAATAVEEPGRQSARSDHTQSSA